jgi:hypothetical protein
MEGKKYYKIIFDITQTLAELLREGMRKYRFDSVSGENISIDFSSPADVEEVQDETSARLCLFLYQVLENPYLKNQEMQKINSDIIKQIPLTLDLFYLLIPYAKQKKTEYEILGRAMQIFYDNAILKGSALKEGLAGTDKEFRVVLYPLSIEEKTQLWNTFPEKGFKLSVCYKVTPVEIESTRKIEAKRVLRKETRYYQIKIKKE